jgi:hypothetical protein
MEPMNKDEVKALGSGIPTAGQAQAPAGRVQGQWVSEGKAGYTLAGQMGQTSRPTLGLDLSNGWKLEIQEPNGVDTWDIEELTGNLAPTDLRRIYTLALFSIRSIDGKQARRPVSLLEARAMIASFGPGHIWAEFIEKIMPLIQKFQNPTTDEVKNESATQ